MTNMSYFLFSGIDILFSQILLTLLWLPLIKMAILYRVVVNKQDEKQHLPMIIYDFYSFV